MKYLLSVLVLALAPLAWADSIPESDIIQQIKKGSVLPLHSDPAKEWADNLLAAQAAASYASAESLQLSILSVLKAISLEKQFGFKFCDESNCLIVNTQSMIAIDPG